jgi:hypothetical protein
MSGQNTPRPGIRKNFYSTAYDKIDFELYGDEKSPPHSSAASSSSAATYIPPSRNRIIPTGVSSMISGRPTIHIEVEEDPPERLKPRKISGPPSYPAPVTTIPEYPRGDYYAKRKTILKHIDKLVPTARYKMFNNPKFEEEKFYLRENPNNGSYFDPGFTIDQLLARERQRQLNWDSKYKKPATKGGRRLSKRHTHQTKRGKRKTRRA